MFENIGHPKKKENKTKHKEKRLSLRTDLGILTIFEYQDKIISINFTKHYYKDRSTILNSAKKQIKEYFLKKRKKFFFPIGYSLTMLENRILHKMQMVGYGKTKSYGEIAKILKTSPRYVGNVCGQNNHLLVIPCHRVIRTDGSLGGFSSSGGLVLKKRLLKLER